jgi:hypothetical protein
MILSSLLKCKEFEWHCEAGRSRAAAERDFAVCPPGED